MLVDAIDIVLGVAESGSHDERTHYVTQPKGIIKHAEYIGVPRTLPPLHPNGGISATV